MPVVRMPDGTNVRFPDEMPKEQIKGLIASKFPAIESRSMADSVGHYAGVAGRAVATGLAFAPGLIADTAVSGINAASGSKLKMPSQGFQETLSKVGIATPQGSGERLTSDALTGLAGGALGGPVAAFSGVTSGLGQGGARELGFGTTGQVVSGILAGMGPVNAANAVKALAVAGYRTTRDILNPANMQNIGKILVRQSDNPDAVIQALSKAAPEYVPGSKPTLGEVAGDNNLIAAQASFENSKPSLMAPTRQANAGARIDYLDEIAKNPAELSQAQLKRSSVTRPLYEAAKNDPVDASAIQPVIAEIDKAIESVGAHTDAGKTLANLKSDINKSLPTKKPSVLINEQGQPLGYQNTKNPNQGPIVQTYKEARDAADKKSLQPGAYSAAVKGIVKPIIKNLGAAIESQSDNMRVANQKFRDLSAPINQMEELQAIRESATKNQPFDIRGNQSLRPAAINAALTNEGRGELAKVLTPEQLKRLDNLQKDLNRESGMRSIRPKGSDTAANLKAGEKLNNVINDIISSKLDKIPLVGRSIRAATEGAIDKGLAKAYANPQDARAAMVSALRALQRESIPAQMKRVALQSILGTSVGTLSPDQFKIIMDKE